MVLEREIKMNETEMKELLLEALKIPDKDYVGFNEWKDKVVQFIEYVDTTATK
jgi:hypothetical protein